MAGQPTAAAATGSQPNASLSSAHLLSALTGSPRTAGAAEAAEEADEEEEEEEEEAAFGATPLRSHPHFDMTDNLYRTISVQSISRPPCLHNS